MAVAEKSMKDGYKEMDKGDFKKAYSRFKKATGEDPANAEAWFLRAETGNMAAGMFGAKISDEDIMESYNKAIELDPENTDYYSSYGSFCISIGKFEEAEGAYNEAATMDESNASRYLAEFAVDYYNAVIARYGEIMEDPAARAPYAKKALQFLLRALELEPEEAKKLL